MRRSSLWAYTQCLVSLHASHGKMQMHKRNRNKNCKTSLMCKSAIQVMSDIAGKVKLKEMGQILQYYDHDRDLGLHLSLSPRMEVTVQLLIRDDNINMSCNRQTGLWLHRRRATCCVNIEQIGIDLHNNKITPRVQSHGIEREDLLFLSFVFRHLIQPSLIA